MNAEYEVRGMAEMRQMVHTWIAWRPTIHHTPQSLEMILTGELTELREAVALRRPQAEITAEVGDVLFSTLALDTNGEKYKPHYIAIARYCKTAGTSLRRLFNETNFKNEVNYPIYFFHRTSPFINSSDAISCLRILRRIDENPKRLMSRWLDSEAILAQLPIMDAYDVCRLFRNFVMNSLTQIQKNPKTDSETFNRINKLISVGRWDPVPLELDIDKPQNDLMLF